MRFDSSTFSAPIGSGYSLATACFRVEVSPLDGDTYESRVEVAELAAVTLALVESQASVVLRRNETVSERRRFSLACVLSGDLLISYQQRMATLRQGDFMLIDNALERTMFVYDSVKLLLICLPDELLRRHLSHPEEALGQVLHDSLDTEKTSLFQPLLRLWQPLKEGQLNAFTSSIEDSLLRSIGKAYHRRGLTRPRSDHVRRLNRRVKAFIEAELRNPQLTVESIAAHFQVSSRYLRSLFQGEEKLSQYILRRRLEESAKQLLDDHYRTSSITDIAYRCGFNSSTHFARCFKALYGERARDFRRRRQVC